MTLATFLLVLCAGGSCIERDGVVQVSVPPQIVGYTRPAELYPRAVIDGRLFVLVPETSL